MASNQTFCAMVEKSLPSLGHIMSVRFPPLSVAVFSLCFLAPSPLLSIKWSFNWYEKKATSPFYIQYTLAASRKRQQLRGGKEKVPNWRKNRVAIGHQAVTPTSKYVRTSSRGERATVLLQGYADPNSSKAPPQMSEFSTSQLKLTKT